MRGDGSHDCGDGQRSCSVVIETDVVAVSWESAKRDREHPEQQRKRKEEGAAGAKEREKKKHLIKVFIGTPVRGG